MYESEFKLKGFSLYVLKKKTMVASLVGIIVIVT